MQKFIISFFSAVLTLGTSAFIYVMSVNMEDEYVFPSKETRSPAQEKNFVPLKEVIPEGEAEANKRITEILEEQLKEKYGENKPARRDFHAKAHGCVKARFEVNNEFLPKELQVGLFSKNQTFPAWIRFSNGARDMGDDSKLGPRGMAIKLLDVPGKKVLESEQDAKTQDFLLINGPNFFVENAAGYIKVFDGQPLLYFITHLGDLHNVVSLSLKKVHNPLFIRYWSETPYALGPTAVKYSAIPCSKEGMETADRKDPDFLKKAMKKNLDKGEACFHFAVQLQKDEQKMPIEDPTKEWKEKHSPFLPVATIKILKQEFDSFEQTQFCENLSLTPWHSLPEHRPVGGINRSRKMVYEAISKLRHEMNEAPKEEP